MQQGGIWSVDGTVWRVHACRVHLLPAMSAPQPLTDAAETPGGSDRPSTATRAGFLLTLVLLAVILLVSARSEQTVAEARLGGRVELMELIRAEQARAETLAGKVEELSAQVSALERDTVGDAAMLEAVESQIEAVAAPAGMTALAGPGVVATLTDSSLSTSPSGDLNDLVIHEQDLQGVINALWAGGAEAMSVNGQRVLATTAIRCVGNTLLLHGAVYSPPYVIAAVGDGVGLRAALDRDPVVERFRLAVQEYQLGFTVEDADALMVPAYEGTTSLQVARPQGAGGSG
jgi:uncharacterized protein YlxW (UPF0749 family)